MQVLSLPAPVRALVFDLDSTLYEDPAYAAFQEEVLVERLARERGEPPAATAAVLAGLRADRERAGLARTSLGRLFAALGIPIETSVAWREELILPGRWLKPDAALAGALASLAARFPLALVTNNPRSVGLASLEALGVRAAFSTVVGLDDTMLSKPDPAPFLMAASRLGLGTEGCVSIGDRRDVDLAPALEAGYGGAILVERVADVYALPALLGAAPDRPEPAPRG